jgi:alpha/beta superfamily hydrolase
MRPRSRDRPRYGAAVLDRSRYDLAVPDGAIAGAVLLHPHPDFGGDRFNVVVEALWRALPAAGVAAVRFDFASSDLVAGTGDAADAVALLPADLPLVVCGYSFGAGVATHVDAGDRLAGWVLVAPPLAMVPAGPVGTDERPKLVLVPAHDQFCPPDALRPLVEGWTAATVEEVPSADHFLAGATAAVAARATAWVTALPAVASRSR